MSWRTCPSCGRRLSFIDVMGPAFKGKGMPVVCPSCARTVSRPWWEYLWLPALGIPLGYLVPDMILDYFGLPDVWVWPVLIAILLLVIYLLFLGVRLEVQPDEAAGETPGEQNGRQVIAIIRPYSSWDKRLLFLSLATAALSLVLLVAAQLSYARLSFVLFVLFFVAFVVKRLQVQFAGQKVVLMQISPGYVEMARLRTLPFFETEVDTQMRIRIADIAKIRADMTPGGSAADPQFTIGFYLQDDRYLYNRIPFHLAEQAYACVKTLKNHLPNVEFEIDERYDV